MQACDIPCHIVEDVSQAPADKQSFKKKRKEKSS